MMSRSGILGADRPDELLRHPAEVLRLHLVVGLVEQVEAETAVGHALVPLGKHGPLVRAQLGGLGLGPEVRPLGRGDLTEARGDVEVEQQVDAMLLAELDGPVDLLQDRLLEVLRVAGIGPVVVVQREPEEVESQVGDVGEVALIEQLSASAPVGDGQVEAPPVRQLPRRGLGQLGTLLVRQHGPGGRAAQAGRRQRHAEHITTIHCSWFLQERSRDNEGATMAPVKVRTTSDSPSPPRPVGTGPCSGQRAPVRPWVHLRPHLVSSTRTADRRNSSPNTTPPRRGKGVTVTLSASSVEGKGNITE